jgi:hypothetical protein
MQYIEERNVLMMSFKEEGDQPGRNDSMFVG